ncbi:MAG TPA: YihY family inner membrane protein, partial [Casimicrobiaceae bacterium]|nr:YihY family inner membrane protein [Casimicrobiaceae bacterium]
MLRRTLLFFAFVRRLVRRLTGVGLGRSAASLAFTTLFGLVPLFTVAFTYVARFPIFERSQDALESLLLRYFLPGSSTLVHKYLSEFSANSAQLKGIGTFFVLLTVVLMVVQVDQEINTIWGAARERRSLGQRVL